MPGATLHLTHVELLSEDPRIPGPLRRALQRELTSAKLGAVFVDLPFYTNILTMMVGYWLEMPAETCPFAQKMHRYHPDRFAWHFLTHAYKEGQLSREQRIALMAGYFSHVALDLEIHPLVNWCARRDVILHGGNESHHHRLAEKHQSLFFHADLLGSDILGQRGLFTNKTRIVDHSAFFRRPVDAPVVRWSTDLLAGYFHESAPGMREFAGWIRSFRHFAFCVSLPMAARNSQKSATPENRQLYYENSDFCFDEYWNRGYERSIELLTLAWRIFERGKFDAAARDQFLSLAAITDLAYPPERGLPALPEYQDLEVQLGLAS